jgi:hypothetical protein
MGSGITVCAPYLSSTAVMHASLRNEVPEAMRNDVRVRLFALPNELVRPFNKGYPT